MKAYYDTGNSLYGHLCNTYKHVKIILLNKVDVFVLHKHVSMYFDGVCEDLTWDNDLIFNCETYSHEDLYNNLFKMKFKGVQLGQE